MFKNEIENLKKLKLNGTFEFIDCDKRKMIYVRWMEICDNCIEFNEDN